MGKEEEESLQFENDFASMNNKSLLDKRSEYKSLSKELGSLSVEEEAMLKRCSSGIPNLMASASKINSSFNQTIEQMGENENEQQEFKTLHRHE